MKKSIAVGIAQIQRLQGQYSKNYQQHCDFIQQAKVQHIEVLVFPELSLNGYAGENSHSEAISREDNSLKKLSALAPDMLISLGFPEKENGHYFNSQALLYQGKVIAVHRKLNLPHYGKLNEKDYYQAGNNLRLYQHKGVSIHQLICADLWNPALVHIAMLDLPDLLIAPICSIVMPSGNLQNSVEWKKTLAFYSMIYATPIIMANHIEDDSDGCWGGSSIYNAYGQCLVNAGHESTLITTTLDLSETLAARQQLPTIRDADTALVSRLLTRRAITDSL